VGNDGGANGVKECEVHSSKASCAIESVKVNEAPLACRDGESCWTGTSDKEGVCDDEGGWCKKVRGRFCDTGEEGRDKKKRRM